MPYTHLSREQRYQIHALRRQDLSYERIGALVGCHASTVCREFKRNSGTTGYRPAAAHDKARARQIQRRNARSFAPQQWAHVTHYLRAKLSPQQVAGRLKAEGALHISHETIYRFVYRDKAGGGHLIQHLRCQKQRRKRYASGQQRRESYATGCASSSATPSSNSEAAWATGRVTRSSAKVIGVHWSPWSSASHATR
jgi:IS30 family transposase